MGLALWHINDVFMMHEYNEGIVSNNITTNQMHCSAWVVVI